MARVDIKSFIRQSKITFGKLDNEAYSNGEINPIVYLTAEGAVENIGTSIIKYSDQENTYIVFEETGYFISVSKDYFGATILEYKQLEKGIQALVINDNVTSLPLIIQNDCSIKLDKKTYLNWNKEHRIGDIPIEFKILVIVISIASAFAAIMAIAILLMSILQ